MARLTSPSAIDRLRSANSSFVSVTPIRVSLFFWSASFGGCSVPSAVESCFMGAMVACSFSIIDARASLIRSRKTWASAISSATSYRQGNGSFSQSLLAIAVTRSELPTGAKVTLLRPWRMALRLARDFPLGVLGPVLLRAFSRHARALFVSEVMAGDWLGSSAPPFTNRPADC